MTQYDIFEWLRRQRLTGNDQYFTVAQIRSGLAFGHGAIIVHKKVVQLYNFGFLERTEEHVWLRRYRVKKKYVFLKEENQ